MWIRSRWRRLASPTWYMRGSGETADNHRSSFTGSRPQSGGSSVSQLPGYRRTYQAALNASSLPNDDVWWLCANLGIGRFIIGECDEKRRLKHSYQLVITWFTHIGGANSFGLLASYTTTPKKLCKGNDSRDGYHYFCEHSDLCPRTRRWEFSCTRRN